MSDATPLKGNLQLEEIDIWGVHFVCISLCQSNISTSWRPWTICPNGWITSCVAADSKNSKKMVQEITFPCFEFPRVVSGSEGSHFTRSKTNRKCLSKLRLKPLGCYSIPPLDQWPGRNISQEDQKHSVEESECHGKGWNSTIPEELWAYKTAFKTPIGQTPHQLIYGRTCRVPVDLEFRSHGAIKRWKMDLQSARVKRKIQ